MATRESKIEAHSDPISMAGLATHDSVIKLVQSQLTVPSRIADLAAREGAFSVKVRDFGHSVVAVDAFDDHWKVPDIGLIVQDLDSEFALSIVDDDNKFDGVVAVEIVEHLENPFRFFASEQNC